MKFFSLVLLINFITYSYAQASPIDQFIAELKILETEKSQLTEDEKKIDPSVLRYYRYNILKQQPSQLPCYSTYLPINNGLIKVELKGDLSEISVILQNKNIKYNLIPNDKIIANIPVLQAIELSKNINVHAIKLSDPYIINNIEPFYTHSIDVARSKLYRGQNIKVGVLSDSCDKLLVAQQTGNLPNNVIVVDAGSGSGEGTAMMEIIYKLAPDVQLYFASAIGGDIQFANRIRQLRDLGCKIIVDDIGYSNESPFQDGVIAQAVQDVISSGVYYFSSAGNDGNAQSFTSTTWEGDFISSGISPPSIITFYGAGPAQHYTMVSPFRQVHMFTSQTYANMLLSNPRWITLSWNDPNGQSTNDFDIYVINSAGNILLSSQNRQTGTQNPYEFISVGLANNNITNMYIVIVAYNVTSPKYLRLTSPGGKLLYSTSGAIAGHSAVEDAFCVAAVNSSNKNTRFTRRDPLENFSSDGPRRIFFNQSGIAYTPENYTKTGGYVRKKPDIAASDGMKTSVDGFTVFYGTSAAAPTAAAMCAILLSANPDLTPTQMRTLFTTNTINKFNGWNNMFGYGIPMMDQLLQAIGK